MEVCGVLREIFQDPTGINLVLVTIIGYFGQDAIIVSNTGTMMQLKMFR